MYRLVIKKGKSIQIGNVSYTLAEAVERLNVFKKLGNKKFSIMSEKELFN